MIRKLLSPTHSGGHGKEIKRNNDIQRIETFSDGVFAFAVTLLIVSLEVPKTFEELMYSIRGFFAFGICFLLLVSIWKDQHKFFRNYGLDDSYSVNLNVFLLFIVLFYVYPLKFLFTLFFGEVIYGQNKSPISISGPEMPQLMVIYALGFIIIYFIFFLMYRHALKKSKELGLTELEKYDCQTSIYKELIMLIIGVLSLIVAATLQQFHAANAGYVYMLIWPALHFYYRARNTKRKKLFTA